MTRDETAGRPRGALTIALGILSSRVFGFVRAMVAARYFGVGAYADVFGTAFRAPNLLQVLLGEQTLSASFIPTYSRFLKEGRDEAAGRFAGAVLGLLVAAAATLSLLGVLFAEPLVSVFTPGYLLDAAAVAAGTATVDRFPIAVDAVRIVFPMAGILVLSAWSLGILNSHRRFFLPYVAPVLWNSAIIAALVGAARWSSGAPSGKDLVIAGCWGALAGGLLQFLVQLPAVARVVRGFRLSFSLRVEGVREALRALGPVLLARGVVQLSSYLDQVLASLLVAGAVSALDFAARLYLLPLSLFAMSVAAAELPALSQIDDHGPLVTRVVRASSQMGFLMIPTAVGYLVLGKPIVDLVFGRGAFGAGAIRLVALVLAAYSVGLVPSGLSRLFQNLFYAMRDTRTPARIAMARVVCSAGFGVALMFLLDRQEVGEGTDLRLGAVGLAVGAAAGGWLELLLLRRALRRRLPDLVLPARRFLGFLLLALVGAGAALGGLALAGRPTGAIPVLAALGGYAGIYLGAAFWLTPEELGAWTALLRRRRR